MSDTSSDLVSELRGRVAELGFELVDVRQRGVGKRLSLQVRIDRPNSSPGHGVTTDDCALVSRSLEAWLDSTGILGDRYVLEVSSPGMERPIRWPEHWQRFTGYDVRVRLADRGRVRATILGVSGTGVELRIADGDELHVQFDEARDATLVVDWATPAKPTRGRRRTRKGRK